MTTNYKMLGQTAPTAATETLHYTAPSSTSALVKTINIANTSSSPDSYSIALPTTLLGQPMFVLGAINGAQMASSTDGITWISRTIAGSNFNQHGTLAFGNNTFVTINGNSGSPAFSSTDAITWTERTSAGVQSWTNLIFGNGIFFSAKGAYSTPTLISQYSTNGITWTLRTLTTLSQYRTYQFSHANGIFFAFGSGSTYNGTPGQHALTSTDTVTWTARNSLPTLPDNYGWTPIVYGNGVYVTVAASTTKGAVSTDAITWTLTTIANANWTRVVFGNGLFVKIASSSTTASTSTDGITWTVRTLPANTLSYLSFGNGIFIAVTNNQNSTTAASSTNGITWTLRTAPVQVTGSTYWGNAAFGQFDAPTINADYIALDSTIPANSTVTIKAGYTLATGNAIRVKSTNGTSTFTSFGAEIS